MPSRSSTHLAGPVLATVPEQHCLTDQLAGVASVREQLQHLTLVVEAGRHGGIALAQLLQREHAAGDVATHVGLAAVDEHRRRVGYRRRPQGQALGQDRVVRCQHRRDATVYEVTCRACAIWDDGYLAYDFGEHPMNPVRLELTIRLARELGVLERLEVLAPVAADEAQLRTVHDADYLAAVRTASSDPDFTGFGLGTDDDPVFAGMYEASALIAGGSALAARRLWAGDVEHAVNIAGGLPPRDARVRIGLLRVQRRGARHPHPARRRCGQDRLRRRGRPPRRRGAGGLLRRSAGAHGQPPSGSTHPVPGTGRASEIGSGAAAGTAVKPRAAAGHRRRRLAAGFPSGGTGAVRAFGADVLVTQCGCDTTATTRWPTWNCRSTAAHGDRGLTRAGP